MGDNSTIPEEFQELLMDEDLLDKKAAKEPPNPYQFSSERAQKEFNMWKTWKSSPTPDNLRPLVSSFGNLLSQTANKYKGKVTIPPSVIDAEVQTRFVDALHTYNPEKAQLFTHMNYAMKGVRRYVAKYQNIGHIPEARTYKIDEYNKAFTRLSDTLGRVPSLMELSQELRWPISEVELFEREQKKDLLASNFPDDPMKIQATREEDVLRYIYYELTPEEQVVFEHVSGMNGKMVKKPGEIATMLNISPSKVSRLIASIREKVQKRL